MLLIDGTYVRIERQTGAPTATGRREDRLLVTFTRRDGIVITVPLAAPDVLVLADALRDAWPA